METSYFLSLHYMMKTITVEPAILWPLTKDKCLWMIMSRKFNVKFQSPVLMVSELSPVIVKCMWRSVSSRCTWCLHPPPLRCSHNLYCWCRISDHTMRALSIATITFHSEINICFVNLIAHNKVWTTINNKYNCHEKKLVLGGSATNSGSYQLFKKNTSLLRYWVL